MGETYYDAIRNFSMDEMARFLCALELTEFVPKNFRCDTMICHDCKDDLSCFKEWLQQEVKTNATK